MSKLEIQDDLGDEKIVSPIIYNVSSYGIDWTVEVIISKLRKEEIYKPEFQRKYVWNQKYASRFIESLLIGLPVPNIFLSMNYKDNKFIIIDGLQRLLTLLYFYDGKFENGKKFKLINVQPQFEGKGYEELKEEDKRRLNDSIIHAIIIKQDSPKEKISSSVYHLFERINTGGMILTAQEIRSSLFYGSFNNLIKELNNNEEWRKIYGKKSDRLRDEELILRFFALYENYNSYKEPMKNFLNVYMEENKKIKNTKAKEFRSIFNNTIHILFISINKNIFRIGYALNAAIFDSIMIGLAYRLKKGEIRDIKMVKNVYEELTNDKIYQENVLKATGDKKRVTERIEMAINVFNDVQ